MLRKIAAALALVAGSASAQVDFTGAYLDSSGAIQLITQRGSTAVVTLNNILAAGATAGESNSFGWGIGVVTGSVLNVSEYYPPTMYCKYSLLIEMTGNAITVTGLSAETTARGKSVNAQCAPPGIVSVRQRLL